MPYTRAQLLAAFRQDHPELGQVDDNALFRAIAQDAPELARGAAEFQPPEAQAPDDRSAGRVALDQTGNVLKGALGALTGIPGMAMEVGGIVKDTIVDPAKAQQRAGDMAKGMYEGVVAPVKPIMQTVAPGTFGEPTREGWEQGAQAAGGNAAGLMLAPGGAKAGAGMAMKIPGAAKIPGLATVAESGLTGLAPEALRLQELANKARNYRTENPVIETLSNANITQPAGMLRSGVRAGASAGAAVAAPLLEKLAKLRAGAPEPAALAAPEEAPTMIPERPTAPRVAAADELQRSQTWDKTPAEPQFTNEPMNQPYPQDPALETLKRLRQESMPDPELQVPPPSEPAALAGPEPMEPPVSILPQAAPPVAPTLPWDVRMAEQGIAPSGVAAKLNTIRNIPDLLAEIPELRGTSKGPAFDSKLVNGFKRTESNLHAVEETVPRETRVPMKDAVDQLLELEDEYAIKGQNKAVASLAKMRERFAELGPTVPWEQFRDIKRAFFQEVSPGNAVGRKAYRVLMDVSDAISPELTKANRSYFIVRSALENAKIDRFTGRRIMDVGKPIK